MEFRMARTFRNPNAKSRIYRKPRHKSALRAKSDEYGIRPGAVPPTNYDDISLSAQHEDFRFYKLERKYDRKFDDLRRINEI